MRHRNTTKKLDRKKGPREMMLRNLAASVIMYEKVKTTEAKAKVVRSVVERAITASKQNNLTARRRLLALLPQKKAVKKLMEVLNEKYKGRKGGYTRTVKLGTRQGDGARIVQIELV
ncbi:50S ribosomal protein L17 [Candidatus Falkowbacteria bacterium RIFOXYC2_FULL_47_12]|uniref:50S ribosomal protein L17 n=2 Tax=Candidatus Falkowiibacteriota TaxID=1752728 RepID=A0A1F5TS27_9BACT|nr:MAG: 50S ribosomal protein L17 [Candidatus Falkowbacteria bacterium RIFOXYA2_FULL_47_9]OGF41401.1 MAG: 50S ribosomal protein L17 [Candidatus Falkowbacteria bacterium RIFOXYC2_FULL_47_12]